MADADAAKAAMVAGWMAKAASDLATAAVLIGIAAERDVSLRALGGAATELTPYATEFRYPGELLEPTARDAEAALRSASKFVDTIRKALAQSSAP